MKEDIIGLSTLMIIFGIMLILVGIYIFTGHKNGLLFWRTKSSIKSMTNDYSKKSRWNNNYYWPYCYHNLWNFNFI